MQLQMVLVPFSVALLLSIMFQPLVVFLKSKRIPTAIALLVVLISLATAVGLIGLVVYQSARSLAGTIDHYEERVDILAEQAMATAARIAAPLGVEEDELDFSQIADTSVLTSIVQSGLGSVFSFVANTFMVLLFMLFILAGSGGFAIKIRRAYAPETASRLNEAVNKIVSGIRRYLVAKTFVSALTGVLFGLSLWILGVDFPVFWGFMAFVLNFIPNIGSIAAVLLAFAASLLQFPTLTTPLIALICMATIQMVVGNVVDPWVMASNLNISPLLVLVSLIFWSWLWGIVGAVLAVPMIVAIKVIFENLRDLRPLAIIMGTADEPVTKSVKKTKRVRSAKQKEHSRFDPQPAGATSPQS